MDGTLDYGLRRFSPPREHCGTNIYAVGHHTRAGVAPSGVDLTVATYGLLTGTTRPGWIRIGDRWLTLPRGDVVLLFPGQRYRYGPQARTRAWPHAVALWDGLLPRSLHRAGVIDPQRPLWRLADPAAVARAFAACAPGHDGGMTGALLTLLEAALAGRAVVDLPVRPPRIASTA